MGFQLQRHLDLSSVVTNWAHLISHMDWCSKTEPSITEAAAGEEPFARELSGAWLSSHWVK